MAITQIPEAGPTGYTAFTDTTIGASADGIKASSATLYSVVVDNSANGGAASYVKLYNAASGSVTVGTTVPDKVIFAPGGARVSEQYFTAASPGLAFSTALTAACVTTGGTAGSAAPASAVVFTANYV